MLKKIVLKSLDLYQGHVRILLPCACRFVPSCSEYMKLAILKYGVFKGALKGTRRILRCQPFSNRSGYDPLT